MIQSVGLLYRLLRLPEQTGIRAEVENSCIFLERHRIAQLLLEEVHFQTVEIKEEYPVLSTEDNPNYFSID